MKSFNYKDLLRILKKEVPVVIFKEEMNYLETQFEKGMLAQVTSIKVFGENLIITFNESKFSNYNKSLESATWYNEKTDENDSKFSNLYKREIELCLNNFDLDEDLSQYFKIYTNEISMNLKNTYSRENPKMSYVKWLEKKVSSL